MKFITFYLGDACFFVFILCMGEFMNVRKSIPALSQHKHHHHQQQQQNVQVLETMKCALYKKIKVQATNHTQALWLSKQRVGYGHMHRS